MNKADRIRLDVIHRLPCMACVQEGMQQPNATEAHHIVDKGYRKHSGGHRSTIPLCGWHHRGEPLIDRTKPHMRFIYGPSLADTKREFVERYGSERDLLERFDGLLRASA